MLTVMANHPNRSKQHRGPAANPTPAEILSARESAGLTQQEAGELLHTGWRTWQNWELEGPENRRMPPAAWELFKVKVNARQMIDQKKITRATVDELGLTFPAAE